MNRTFCTPDTEETWSVEDLRAWLADETLAVYGKKLDPSFPWFGCVTDDELMALFNATVQVEGAALVAAQVMLHG